MEAGGRGTGRKRLMVATEEFSGVNVTTTSIQPGVLLIEPLGEDLKCIKVSVSGVGDSEESLDGFKLQSTSTGNF